MKKKSTTSISLFSIFVVLVIVVLFFNVIRSNKTTIVINNRNEDKDVDKNTNQTNKKVDNVREMGGWGMGWGLSWPYFNNPLSNPYVPPLRDERYFVPINVPTNIGAVPLDNAYRQLGMLTNNNNNKNKNNKNNKIMALMGRPLFTNRDKWQYYAISDQYNGIKLPLRRRGQNCMNEYGCDKLYTGDIVFVEGLQEPCRVTLYENDTIHYLPFL